MNDANTELERWLAGGDYLAADDRQDVWDPGFEIDRHVVCSKIGGVYQKVFLRPSDFSPRFYHEIYSLPIDDWLHQESIALFDGFCHVDVELEIRFQATLKYAQRNIGMINESNQRIKKIFQTLMVDIVHRKINELDEGAWIQEGLGDVEENIVDTIHEQLLFQNIQSQAICKLAARFADFPNIHPGRDSIFLYALKQSHELNEQKNQAFFKQQSELKKQKLVHKQQQLEQLQQIAEIEREKKKQEAVNKLLILQDREKQLAGELDVEKRIHAQKLAHQTTLKEMQLDADLVIQRSEKNKHRLAEQQDLEDSLAHQVKLEEKKNSAELAKRERGQLIQTKLHEDKTQAEIERYEKQQETWREAKLRIHQQQLALKHKQKVLELEAEQEFLRMQEKEKAKNLNLPFRILEKDEDVFKSRMKSAELRKEIQLSVLEKQRLELEAAIKEAQIGHAFDNE